VVSLFASAEAGAIEVWNYADQYAIDEAERPDRHRAADVAQRRAGRADPDLRPRNADAGRPARGRPASGRAGGLGSAALELRRDRSRRRAVGDGGQVLLLGRVRAVGRDVRGTVGVAVDELAGSV
jgi:hypothetical protein